MRSISIPSCCTAIIFMAYHVEGGAYQDGFKEGERKARHLWHKDYNKDCIDIFQYTVEAKDDLYNGEYKASRRDNWRNEAFKKGGRDGVGSEVLVHQEDCISPSYCDDLGETAAEVIVSDFCEVMTAFAANERSPVRFCRKSATATCQGKLFDIIKKMDSCPEIDDNIDNLTRDQLWDLQDECEELVDEWIEWDDLKRRDSDSDSDSDKSKGKSTSDSRSDSKKHKKNKKKKKGQDRGDQNDNGYNINRPGRKLKGSF